MADANDRIACFATGVRARRDLQRLVEVSDKLVTLTVPGDHDPLEVAARDKEFGQVVNEIRRDAADSVRCGVPEPTFDERGDLVQLAPQGKLLPDSWVRHWVGVERMTHTADPHARAVGTAETARHLVESLGWDVNRIPRPGGSPPQGEVTLKLGPKQNFLFTPTSEEDLETAKHLETWLKGEAKQEGGVSVATHLYKDGALSPPLSDALAHLRNTLAAVTVGSDTHVLILWNEKARVLDVDGHADPYKGSTWSVQITPNYTVQNQREIAEYVRHYEDQIAEEVRRLIPRKRRATGWKVEFYAKHPGVEYAKHIEVGPPEHDRGYSYMLPDYHPEGTYTPLGFKGKPAHEFGKAGGAAPEVTRENVGPKTSVFYADRKAMAEWNRLDEAARDALLVELGFDDPEERADNVGLGLDEVAEEMNDAVVDYYRSKP